MNENFRFRESFRGYNRDDVNAYIEQINIAFSRKEAELRAYIAELENHSAGVSTTRFSENEFHSLQAELNKAKDEIERLNQELSRASQAPSDHSEDVEKSKLYDSMSAQVGNILIVANSNADKILAEANLAAEQILAEAHMDAEKIKMDAEQKSDAMVRQLDEHLKEVSDCCICEYSKLVTEAQTRFKGLSETIKSDAEKILVSLDERSKELESKIFDDYGDCNQVIEG